MNLHRDRIRLAAVIAIVVALLTVVLAVTVVDPAINPDPDSGTNAGADAGGAEGSDDTEVAGLATGDQASGPGDPDDGDDESAAGEETLEVDLLDDSSEGEGGAGQEVPLDDDATEGADPCESVPAGRSLLVTPHPLVLPATQMASELHIRNCGTEAVDWTALTVPEVTLASAGDTLDAGAETTLGFTIDESALDPGAFTFKIKVSEPGANTYVDVHAFKGLVNPLFHVPGGPVLQGAPGSGGCALQCITKAWLTPNATTPNLSLEVTTKVPARHRVWVSTSEPVVNDDVPSFPGVAPIATNDSPTTSWTTPLAPLTAATDYHIIVEATDEHGKRAYQVGEFRTITPVPQPGGLAPTGHHGGCAAGCVTKALINQPSGSEDPTIEIVTNVPARVKIWVSEQAPATDGNGTPQPAGTPAHSTGNNRITSWTPTLTGLRSNTTYHVVVEATDDQGARTLRAGQFHTLEEVVDVLVTFHQIHVIRDGDASSVNRGELRFRLGVNFVKVAETPERKIHSGTTLNLEGPGRSPISHLVTGVSGNLPTVQVQGFERDNDLLREFCTMGTGILEALWGHIPTCDLVYDTAGSGIVAVDDVDALPSCAGVGNAPVGARCVWIETADRGDNFPHFKALVSFQIVGG